MMQGPDQPIPTYVASLKARARTCGYKIKCTDEVCNQTVDHTNTVVLQQIIRGLVDEVIQWKLLARSELTLKEAEKFFMAEESGKWSQVDSKSDHQVVAGMSSFKQQQKSKPCVRCGGTVHISEGRVTEDSIKSQCPAFKAKCRKCNQRGHFARVCKSKKEEKGDKEEANVLEAECLIALKKDSLVVMAKEENMGGTS